MYFCYRYCLDSSAWAFEKTWVLWPNWDKKVGLYSSPSHINLCYWTRVGLHFIIFDSSVLLLHNFRFYLHKYRMWVPFLHTSCCLKASMRKQTKRAFLLTTKVGLYRSSADWGAPSEQDFLGRLHDNHVLYVRHQMLDQYHEKGLYSQKNSSFAVHCNFLDESSHLPWMRRQWTGFLPGLWPSCHRLARRLFGSSPAQPLQTCWWSETLSWSGSTPRSRSTAERSTG